MKDRGIYAQNTDSYSYRIDQFTETLYALSILTWAEAANIDGMLYLYYINRERGNDEGN